MDWKKERDELIAQTLAFVQSVSAQIPEGAKWKLAKVEEKLAPVPPGRLEISGELHVQASSEPIVQSNMPAPGPAPAAELSALPRSAGHSEVEGEFRARIASFRAHQERFNRERAEYFNATIARLRAALQDVPRPGQVTHQREPLSPISFPRPAANIPETFPGSRSSENAQGRS